MLLKLDGVTKRFEGLTAVNKVNMTIEEGEIVGLIGPNGAGKTTLMNLISGSMNPNSAESSLPAPTYRAGAPRCLPSGNQPDLSDPPSFPGYDSPHECCRRCLLRKEATQHELERCNA